jgi:hypothetical protein
MSGVSVIVPCYNYGRHLAQCLDSVLSQEGVDVSVLVIDDCSTDDSRLEAERLATLHPAVEVRSHAVNRGHIATYNEGLEWADEPYVLVLSADDLLTPGALARAVEPMERDARIGLVYGQTLEFTSAEDLPPVRDRFRGVRTWSGDEWLARRCRDASNVVPTPTAVVRTAVQHRVGGYRPELPHAGDLEMWLRVSAVSDVAYVQGVPQAYYRVHPTSMSQGVYRERLADIRERREVFSRFFEEHPFVVARAGLDPGATMAALAREPLWWACRSYELGTVADDPIEEWIGFARDTCPDLDRVWTHRALARRRRLGERLVHRTQVFAGTGARRKVQAWWWRREWERVGG